MVGRSISGTQKDVDTKSDSDRCVAMAADGLQLSTFRVSKDEPGRRWERHTISMRPPITLVKTFPIRQTSVLRIAAGPPCSIHNVYVHRRKSFEPVSMRSIPELAGSIIPSKSARWVSSIHFAGITLQPIPRNLSKFRPRKAAEMETRDYPVRSAGGVFWGILPGGCRLARGISLSEVGAERKRPGEHTTEIPFVNTAPIFNRPLARSSPFHPHVTFSQAVLDRLSAVLFGPKSFIPEPRQVSVRCMANRGYDLHGRSHPHRLL